MSKKKAKKTNRCAACGKAVKSLYLFSVKGIHIRGKVPKVCKTCLKEEEEVSK